MVRISAVGVRLRDAVRYFCRVLDACVRYRTVSYHGGTSDDRRAARWLKFLVISQLLRARAPSTIS